MNHRDGIQLRGDRAGRHARLQARAGLDFWLDGRGPPWFTVVGVTLERIGVVLIAAVLTVVGWFRFDLLVPAMLLMGAAAWIWSVKRPPPEE